MNNPTLLRTDEHGAILIGDTRITLDVIIAAFQNGDSPEQILEGFPSLKLADIYAVIAYYLNHKDEIDAYLRRRDKEAERIHREIEAKRPDMFRLQRQLRERIKPE